MSKWEELIEKYEDQIKDKIIEVLIT